MIIRWEDRDWEWKPEEITVGMAREIRDFTGKGLRSWTNGIGDGEVDSLIALWWAVQAQNGVNVPIVQVDISPNLFFRAVDEAAMAELRKRTAVKETPKFSPKGSPTRKRTRMSATTETATSSS